MTKSLALSIVCGSRLPIPRDIISRSVWHPSGWLTQQSACIANLHIQCTLVTPMLMLAVPQAPAQRFTSFMEAPCGIQPSRAADVANLSKAQLMIHHSALRSGQQHGELHQHTSLPHCAQHGQHMPLFSAPVGQLDETAVMQSERTHSTPLQQRPQFVPDPFNQRQQQPQQQRQQSHEQQPHGSAFHSVGTETNKAPIQNMDQTSLMHHAMLAPKTPALAEPLPAGTDSVTEPAQQMPQQPLRCNPNDSLTAQSATSVRPLGPEAMETVRAVFVQQQDTFLQQLYGLHCAARRQAQQVATCGDQASYHAAIQKVSRM
jgi:hypothetical protein